MKHISFTIPGLPSPGGSKKAFYNRRTGKVIIVDDAGQKNKNWRAVVAFWARTRHTGAPLLSPLQLSVTFCMPRPKSHRRKDGTLKPRAPFFVPTRPDTTKLLRALEDALTGILWQDDSQIVVQSAAKLYTNGTPGAMVDVWEIETNEACEENMGMVPALSARNRD